jgi:hypothetical protein
MPQFRSKILSFHSCAEMPASKLHAAPALDEAVGSNPMDGQWDGGTTAPAKAAPARSMADAQRAKVEFTPVAHGGGQPVAPALVPEASSRRASRTAAAGEGESKGVMGEASVTRGEVELMKWTSHPARSGLTVRTVDGAAKPRPLDRITALLTLSRLAVAAVVVLILGLGLGLGLQRAKPSRAQPAVSFALVLPGIGGASLLDGTGGVVAVLLEAQQVRARRDAGRD